MQHSILYQMITYFDIMKQSYKTTCNSHTKKYLFVVNTVRFQYYNLSETMRTTN